jgi:hypothetical protein
LSIIWIIAKRMIVSSRYRARHGIPPGDNPTCQDDASPVQDRQQSAGVCKPELMIGPACVVWEQLPEGVAVKQVGINHVAADGNGGENGGGALRPHAGRCQAGTTVVAHPPAH